MGNEVEIVIPEGASGEQAQALRETAEHMRNLFEGLAAAGTPKELMPKLKVTDLKKAAEIEKKKEEQEKKIKEAEERGASFEEMYKLKDELAQLGDEWDEAMGLGEEEEEEEVETEAERIQRLADEYAELLEKLADSYAALAKLPSTDAHELANRVYIFLWEDPKPSFNPSDAVNSVNEVKELFSQVLDMFK